MENPEKQTGEQKGLTDQIFELEKQLDQMRAFVQKSEPHLNESQDLKNKVENFKKEIKKLTFELIQLRLKYREEENKK